jgi:predicted O-methyltransferase YrrM
MDYIKLTKGLTEAIAGYYDDDFLRVVNAIHCMSRPRIYAVLNACVAAMEPGEIYVEVGTYQGGSLISALLNNQARAVAIDSFEEFQQTNNFRTTQDNLITFGVAERVQLYDCNYQTFFAEHRLSVPISVYYYDGAHGYEVQLAGMEAAWPFLAPGALIIVDDYTYPEVTLAVNQFMANHINDVKFQFMFDPIQSTDETWWNGCVVLRKVR